MSVVEEFNLVDTVMFMVVKNLHILPTQQIQIDFIGIVADTYDKGTLRIEFLDFFAQR